MRPLLLVIDSAVQLAIQARSTRTSSLTSSSRTTHVAALLPVVVAVVLTPAILLRSVGSRPSRLCLQPPVLLLQRNRLLLLSALAVSCVVGITWLGAVQAFPAISNHATAVSRRGSTISTAPGMPVTVPLDLPSATAVPTRLTPSFLSRLTIMSMATRRLPMPLKPIRLRHLSILSLMRIPAHLTGR